MKLQTTLGVMTLTLSTILPTFAQTGEAAFHNAYGTLNVRGTGNSASFASFSLAAEVPGTIASVRPVYNASDATKSPIFNNRALYTVVPRLPANKTGFTDESGEGITDFASFGIKTETSLLNLMSANYMATVIRSTPGQEDNYAKYYEETQDHSRNYYMRFGGNIDPATGVMRVAGKNGSVSMMIPTSVLLSMARSGRSFSGSMTGNNGANGGSANGRGGNGKSGNGSGGENGDFGAISLSGSNPDENVFDISLTDLESASAVMLVAPADSNVVINVDDANGKAVQVAFNTDGTTFHHDFIPPISGSLAAYASQAGGFGSSQLTSLPSINVAGNGYSGSGNNTFGSNNSGGTSLSGVSYVPEGKSLPLMLFGLVALAPLARKRRTQG